MEVADLDSAPEREAVTRAKYFMPLMRVRWGTWSDALSVVAVNTTLLKFSVVLISSVYSVPFSQGVQATTGLKETSFAPATGAVMATREGVKTAGALVAALQSAA